MFNISRRYLLCASMLSLVGAARVQARSLKPFSLWVEVDLASRTSGIGQAIVQGVSEALRAEPELAQLIEVQIINHHGNPDRLIDRLNVLAKASDMQRVIGVIGGGDGNLAPLAARWAVGRQLPYLVTWASNPRIFAQIQAEAQTQSYLLRQAVSDDVIFERYLAVLQQVSKPRWGLMLVNDALGRASYDYILENAMAPTSGLELVGIEWHDINAARIGMQYQTLKQRGAQSIFMVSHPYAVQSLAKSLATSMPTAEKLSRQRPITPIICSSNAWGPQLDHLNQGFLRQVPLYFALPQAWQGTASNEPASGFAKLFVQEWLSTLAQTPLTAHTVLGKAPLLSQLLPPSTWRDESLAWQFVRYQSGGAMTFGNLSAAWTS